MSEITLSDPDSNPANKLIMSVIKAKEYYYYGNLKKISHSVPIGTGRLPTKELYRKLNILHAITYLATSSDSTYIASL